MNNKLTVWKLEGNETFVANRRQEESEKKESKVVG